MVDGFSLIYRSAQCASFSGANACTSGSIAAARGRKRVGERVWTLCRCAEPSVDCGVDGRKWDASLDKRPYAPDMTSVYALCRIHTVSKISPYELDISSRYNRATSQLDGSIECGYSREDQGPTV